jgi:hypothetical protein
MILLDKVQRTDFLPFVNQTFRIRLEGLEPIDLTLVQVTEAGQAAQPDVRQPFSLQFLGPVSSQYLTQHIYRLDHEEMGALELFIVPLGTEAEQMRYEAIFT